LKIIYGAINEWSVSEVVDRGVEFNLLKSDIIFNRVSFKYGNRSQLFKDFEFKIPYGKITVLTGPSGCGKSTIADLLLGMFFVQNGGILINDIDIKNMNLIAWRRKVGFITQDNFIFNTSIRENILLGKPSASEIEIYEAAKKAHAHEFIMSFPEKYETVVGDRGAELSGGERQRIAIARAIIRNPEFYIFDEATSSLDRDSEKIIQSSISEIGKNKTVLVITHNLDSVQNADIIYKLQNGKVSEISRLK
jgi:ABC-type multidrug transport system fused ATPase/permease subunit